MVIVFVIWSVCAIIFLLIGISCRRSKEAAGFFTFVKPPTVENVEKYNRAVSVLWFAGAAVFEGMGVPTLFFGQNSPGYVFLIPALMVWAIGMMVIYTRIEAKHRKEK